jgi:ABC-2 type transport system ATP-binding protein
VLDGAGKRYGSPRPAGGVWAVRNVSAAVGPGVTAVIGPNGAGKTTLLRLAGGLVAPTKGSVRLGDFDAVEDGTLYRDAVGYMPQQPGFYEEMTPFSFLMHMSALKLIPRSLGPDRCAFVLESVGLGYAAKRRIYTLSDGSRLRLALAQALLNDPYLLVLDEPADRLDPEGRVDLFAMLRRGGSERITLFSTHALDDLPDLADSVLYLRDGEAVFWGGMADFFLHGIHPCCSGRFSSRGQLHGRQA